MSSRSDLLFELGTEELPAGQLNTMADALASSLTEGLSNTGLDFHHVASFATPRRLAVLVSGVLRKAKDTEQQVLGPPVDRARDADGNWTGAAAGFARKQGIDPDQLQEVDTDKGPRLGIVKQVEGALAETAAPTIIAEAVARIPIAKRMRWGRSRQEFLRPVQWLVAMLDDQVLPLSLFDLNASNETRGHRFHHPEPISLTTASDYTEALRDGHVMASFAERRDQIEAQVKALAAKENAQAVIDDDLLNEVAGLVEWPVALLGRFDKAFLSVPSEALISSMKVHQKYFHLTDASGDLLPMFITVSNIESSDPSLVISGNEKVIRPRLSDAAFFFETDKQTPMVDRGIRLEGIVFQQKLGTLADKTRRIERLSESLAPRFGADKALAVRAASLAKCDLVSELVLEFPELQGIAGAHYARNDGEPEAVVSAIEQHYWPRFATDKLPETPEAQVVALADRIDTLVGIFGIGQTPTGSKDPFGLRRAALAIIRILMDSEAKFDLMALAQEAVNGYPEGALQSDTAAAVTDYAIERLRAWYEDQGIGVDVLRAVTSLGISDPALIDRRVQALSAFAVTEDAAALAAANKRVANILAKVEAGVEGKPDTTLFTEPDESVLMGAIEAATNELDPLLAVDNYAGALEVLARLRGPVDGFFDNVMVNVDDQGLRLNRYKLLGALRAQFIRIADIAQLSPQS